MIDISQEIDGNFLVKTIERMYVTNRLYRPYELFRRLKKDQIKRIDTPVADMKFEVILISKSHFGGKWNVSSSLSSGLVLLERSNFWKVGYAFSGVYRGFKLIPTIIRHMNESEILSCECFGDIEQVKKDLAQVSLFL